MALTALLEYYQNQILPLWRENNDFGAPDVQDLSAFEQLLSYPRLWLHDSKTWGLEFECTWDVEHGTGVLFQDGLVMQVGLAEAASRAANEGF